MWKRQLILSTLWLAAVGWYWRGYVSLLPTRSANLQYESVWVGWTPEGYVVVSRAQLDPNRVYVKKYGGPISFWRVPELEKVAERFGYGDEIEPVHMRAGDGLVAVGMGSQRRIVDVKSGVTLEDIPQDVRKISFGPGQDPKVLYVRDQSITLRDPRFSKDIWTAQGITAKGAAIHRDLVLLYSPDASGLIPGPASRGVLLLNGATGEIETRYDAVQPLDGLAISDDGRWALVHAGRTSQICDARTGRPLWTLPAKMVHWPRFDTERDEVYLHWATPNGELRESRWRCSDGAELTPPPEHFEWAHRTIDAAGRYAVDTTTPRGWFEQFCGQYVNPALRALGSKRRLPHERTIRVLRDLSTGDVIGPLPTDRYVQFIPGGSAAVAVGGRRIDVFEFPAGRDWWWLIWWGVVPVSVAWGGRGLWWAFRRRRLAE